LFKFEFERGEMENRIVIKILRKQLDHVIIHEQVENGIAIIKNLSANQIDQQFITPRRVFQSKQKHP
jgi:adenine-specific DNA methylase